ncbi:uncharacterized protein LOC124831443, partial [Vigna umbellata]|uniref:uncharacterized protein LOC124831443 n=1 Tax=Vigna umbellata TaxID=87088 RepID=UPI001F5F2F78
MPEKEIMNMVVRKFNMKKRNIATNIAGYSGGGKKSSKNNTVICYECGKDGDIKSDCPEVKNRQKANTSDSDFESEPIEVKYDLLLDAFQEIHAEAMRLQYKLKKELETALQSAKTVKSEVKIVEKNCENCPVHQEKIDYLTSTIAKLTQGKDNLDVVLRSSGRAINRQGIGYKANSNRINPKKFIDLSKPITNACFYCNTIGHNVRNCYYRKVGVSKGKYKWIPNEQPPATHNKGPKLVWVPTSKPFNFLQEKKSVTHTFSANIMIFPLGYSEIPLLHYVSMTTSSSQRKRVKTLGNKNMRRASNLDRWISGDSAQSNFLDSWKMRKLILHKYLKLSFFQNEGFVFQSWPSKQGLKKFVEMEDPWYPKLVRVFYSNLKISDGTLCSRVKGVYIKLTHEVWNNIASYHLRGEKCHLGMEGFHKFTVYQDNSRNPVEMRDYSHYKTGGMKKDDRGSNNTQATTEDLYLLKAIKENIQADWPAAISENMLKVTRLESTMLPYRVFISKVMIHFGVECVNESSESYGRTNMIDKSTLHRMGLQDGPNGWQFKDELADEDEDAAGSSSVPYRSRSEFEKFI